jgi:hypothetical protein
MNVIYFDQHWSISGVCRIVDVTIVLLSVSSILGHAHVSCDGYKVKLSLLRAVEAHRAVRRWMAVRLSIRAG